MSLNRYFFVGLLLLVTIGIRLIPHAPNVTSMAAVSLVSGAALPLPAAIIAATAAMFVSDSVIGFDEWPITASIYFSFIIMVCLGRWLNARSTPSRVLGASLASSTLFYLVTNAAVWRFSAMYPLTADGLIQSYLYAIPFFRNTLFGDLVYTGSLFLAVRYLPVAYQLLRKQQVMSTLVAKWYAGSLSG